MSGSSGIIRRIYRLTVVRGGGLVLTLALTMFQASAFGTGPAADAFHLIRQLIASLTSALEGGVQKLLVPHFVRTGGGAVARRSLMLRLAGLALVLALVFAMAAPWIIALLAPGFDPERRGLAVAVLRILAFGLPLYAAAAVLASQAFAGRRFFLASSAGLLPRALALLGFLVVGIGLGAVGLAWWFLGGMAAMTLALLLAARSGRDEGPVAAERQPPAISGARAAAIAVFFSTQVLLTWSNGFLASLGPVGTTALLFLSLRLLNAAPGMANSAISTVYYTEFARDAATAAAARLATVRKSLVTSVFFILPVCALLLAAADPLLALLLERGAFGAEDRERMVVLLALLAPTLVLNAVFATLNTSAMADPETPLLRWALATGGAALAVRLGLGLALVPVLGLVGLGLALVAGNLAQVTVMILQSRRLHAGLFDWALWRGLAPVFLAAILAGVVAYGLDALHAPLAVILAGFGLTYLGAALLLGVAEVQALLPKARRRAASTPS